MGSVEGYVQVDNVSFQADKRVACEDCPLATVCVEPAEGLVARLAPDASINYVFEGVIGRVVGRAPAASHPQLTDAVERCVAPEVEVREYPAKGLLGWLGFGERERIYSCGGTVQSRIDELAKKSLRRSTDF